MIVVENGFKAFVAPSSGGGRKILASSYKNSVEKWVTLGWNPTGGVANLQLFLTEVHQRTKVNPRTPAFQFPNRLPVFVEKDHSLPQCGDIALFPAEANMTAIERLTTQNTESHITQRTDRTRSIVDIDTLMHLAGYGTDTWKFAVKVAKPQMYFDIFTYPPVPPLIREFAAQCSRQGERTHTKSYRITLGNLEEHQIVVSSPVYGEFYEEKFSPGLGRKKKSMQFFRADVDNRSTILEDRYDGSPCDIYTRMFLSAADMNILATFDGDRVVEIETLDFPEEKQMSMEPVLERVEENLDYMASLADGLYTLTGKGWFITDIELVEGLVDKRRLRMTAHDAKFDELNILDVENQSHEFYIGTPGA